MPHNNPSGINGYFQIELLRPSKIETVLIINRESPEGFLQPELDRIIGSDLWVGMSLKNLVPCLANPTGSGLYFECAGKVGKYIRL